MAIRIDDKKKTIRVSVRDLVAPTVAIGSLAAGGYLPARAALGKDAHESHQAERSDALVSYRKEVHVKYAMRVDDYTAIIQGRIDGVYERRGKLVVEEVKSVISTEDIIERIKAGDFEASILQLQLYAFLLTKDTGKDTEGYLVFISLETDAPERIQADCDPEQVQYFIVGKIRGLLAEHRKVKRRQAQQKRTAEAIVFPFPETRRYQDEMIEAVQQALEGRKNLLISAPAGIGKTVAAIFPSLRYALRNKMRLFFITPKTTQQKIVAETLRMTVGAWRTVSCICLRAKEKMCANDVFYCHPDFCLFARNYYDRLASSTAIEELLAEKVIEPETVYARAVSERLCPFELSLDVALQANVVVCDYNYVFDPAAYLRRFFSEQKYDDAILIVDEVHNLYPRGRDYYSPELNRADIRSLIQRANNSQDPVLQQVADALIPLDRYFEELLEAGREQYEGARKFLMDMDVGFFDEEKAKIESAMLRYFLHKKKHRLPAPEDPFERFYQDFNSFYDVLQLQGEEFSHIYDAETDRHKLKILCKDPSRFLGERIAGFYAAIGMSATLVPPEFFREVLGFDRDITRLVSFPSPFPQENRKVLVVPGVWTTYRLRHRSYEQTARVIEEIVSLKQGNYFVFFPSFEYLEAVGEHLRLPAFTVVRQERTMSEGQRARLLADLTKPGGAHVILAVQAGIFAEGVDYPGEMLIGGIIVGPGLPKYDFEQELMRQYFDERYGAGFEYAYLYPGMNRVVQSAGRVIRSETDRGIIVLLGERFARPEYSSLFPSDWYVYSPSELIVKDYVDEIRRFWAEDEA
jgi:DNA excision repair protein ERCC-2